jgi:hypothetical protein
MSDTITETPIEAEAVPLLPEAASAEAATEQPEPAAPVAEHAHAFPVGSASQQILDAFIDSEADQLSMNEIKAALAHVDPNTVESATRRLTQRGHLLKVSPGIYKLSPMLAAGPEPDPAPDAEDAARAASEEQADRDREEALQRDRERKRLERERARSAALAKQAAADAELRAKLLEACGPNHAPGLLDADLGAVRAATVMGVSLERVLQAVRWRVEQPGKFTRWRDADLIRKAGELFWRLDVTPKLLAAYMPAAAAVTAESAGADAAGAEPTDAESAPAAFPVPPAEDAGAELDTGAGHRAGHPARHELRRAGNFVHSPRAIRGHETGHW